MFDLFYTLYLLCFCLDFIGQVKIFKPVFLGPKSQNDKVSELIGKIILLSFQSHLLFIPSTYFVGVTAI